MANFPLPKGYQRLSKFPIDETEIFTSDASARAYAISPSAYPGQKISVVNDSTNEVDVYVILPDGSLGAIGGSITNLTADNGLTITDNVVELGGILNTDISINLNNSNLSIYNDSSTLLIIDGSGIRYTQDVSNYFTDQSLVDKAYVDSHGGGADENVKVGASGTSDYLNEAYFSQHETNHIRPKITQGKMWQGGVGDVPVEVDPPSGGGASKYIDLVAGTDFNTTAASASTITMLTNQTNNIFPGMAIRFTLSGVLYYAVCTAITPNLLTIAGAPLTTTPGALTTIGFSNLPNSTASEVISISGAFADALSTTLIQNDLLLKGGLFWKKSKAFCVQMSIICSDLDTGTVTTEAQLNTKINGKKLLNSNLIVDTILQNSVVNINTLNYEINYNESIEIELAALAAGTPNYDALNLTAYLTFVFP